MGLVRRTVIGALAKADNPADLHDVIGIVTATGAVVVVDGAFAAGVADSLDRDVPARVAVVLAEAIRHVSVVRVPATAFGNAAIDQYRVPIYPLFAA